MNRYIFKIVLGMSLFYIKKISLNKRLGYVYSYRKKFGGKFY